jgi:hypothetical protein
MKTLLLLPLLSIVSVAALAQTQSPQVVNQVQIPAIAPSIEVPAHPLRMAAVDFGMYKGGYDLANGQTLTLYSSGRRMYAQLGDGERSEIVGAGTSSFVALDRSLKMNFERLPTGDIGGELLIAKTPQVAGEPVQYLLVAMRH